jgi:PAS domain S-box-containing protein
MPDIRALFRSSYAKYLITFAFAMLYILAAVPLFQSIGGGAVMLVAIPVIAATWFLGVWAGVLFAVVAMLINVPVLYLAGFPWEKVILNETDLPIAGTLVIICVVVGYLRATRNVLRLELARRQETEARLHERERFVEKILAAAPIIIYILDLREQRATYVAGRLLRDLGYTPAEIVSLGSRLVVEMFHEEDRPLLADHLRRMAAAEDDDILEVSYRWKTATGGWRAITDRQAVFARSADGAVAQVLSISQDVTERLEMQAALQSERDLLRAIFDNIPDQIAVRDADSRFILANHTLDMRGQEIPIGQVIGRTVHDLFPGDDARLFQAEDRKVIQTGHRLVNMERAVEFQGLKRWFLTTKVPLRDQQMKVRRVLVISREITDLKETEFARLESERQRLALQAEREVTDLKARFITHMSHEIRTPLAVLNSSAYLMQQHFERLSPERRGELLESIQEQVLLLRGVLDGISAVMGSEDTLLSFNPVPADLAAICRDTINEMCATHARAIDFNASGDLAAIRLDPNMIAYIFRALLLNAILYSGPEAPIFTEARRVKNTATVTVTDHGVGIPVRDQNRIFEAFHRGSNVGVVRGTGVSLWVSQNYARLHGGSITFATSENEGSVFTLILPA